MFHYLVGEPCRGGLESLVGSKWEAPGGGGWLWACWDGVAEGCWPGEQECLCSPPQMGQPHLAQEWGRGNFLGTWQARSVAEAT